MRELKENVHFEIKVTLSKDSSNLSPSVLCNVCDTSILKVKTFFSNWTRHIVKCAEKQEIFSPQRKQNTGLFPTRQCLINPPIRPVNLS